MSVLTRIDTDKEQADMRRQGRDWSHAAIAKEHLEPQAGDRKGAPLEPSETPGL